MPCLPAIQLERANLRKHPATGWTNWSKPRLSTGGVNQSVQLCSNHDAASALSLGAQVKYSKTVHTHTRQSQRLFFSHLELCFFFLYRQRNDFFFKVNKKKLKLKTKYSKKMQMERSSVVQQRCSVHKLTVWIGTKESHSDFRHHLQTKKKKKRTTQHV